MKACKFRFGLPTVTALVFSVWFVGVCQADTIVLKNGRRIVVSNAVHEGGKVSGDTPSGRLSLPESIVANLEKDGEDSLPPSPAPVPAEDLQIGPPPTAASA